MAESKKQTKKDIDDLSFEQALDKLRKLAGELETGELDLEKALAGYEEAVRLASRCLNLLKDAEDRVKMISESEGGRLALENFDSENAD